MGAQQVKERPLPNLSSLGASSIRSSRSKPRVPKDSRILGSNIFTEHNGEFKWNPYFLFSRHHTFHVLRFMLKKNKKSYFIGQKEWKKNISFILFFVLQQNENKILKADNSVNFMSRKMSSYAILLVLWHRYKNIKHKLIINVIFF